LRAALAAGSADAHADADAWIVAEAPLAIPVSDAQAAVFRTGVMPALGLYTDNGTTALGLRLRAGVLRNGAAPAGHLDDPAAGGLGTAGVALRFASHGVWIEGVAGGGITGRDLVPAIEAGIGWDFAAGALDLGPSARYVRVVSRDPLAVFGNADLVLVGVDVQLGKAHARRQVRAATAAPATPPRSVEPVTRPVAVAVAIDRDRDRVVEREASCAIDADGCEIAQHVYLHDDRFALEERVVFDSDRARVKANGKELIAQIAQVWRAHPEWRHISIEGHADVRGSDEYNLDLSWRRAERVRDVLVALGIAAERMNAVGYGRARPRDRGTSEAAHQLNRRVEFVIERGGPVESTGGSR